MGPASAGIARLSRLKEWLRPLAARLDTRLLLLCVLTGLVVVLARIFHRPAI